MAKLTTTDLAVSFASGSHTTINNNFAAVETAMEKTLSRDGTSPNTMEASLDMNSNRIINLPEPVSDHEPARLVDLVNIYTGDVGLATTTSDGLMSAEDKAKADAVVYVTDYGAVGNGTTDDSAAFLAAANALDGAGSIHLFPGKSYLIDTDLTLPVGVVIVGPYRGGTPVPGWNTTINWTELDCRLVINSTASIILNGGSGIEGCFIVRKGMTLPAANASAFAGTAVEFASRQDNQYVKDCIILGFTTAILTNNDRAGVTPQCSRFTIERVWLDCTNGIDIDTTYDSARIRDVHMWPFATIETYAAGGSVTHSLITRSGSGIKVRNAADDLQLDGVIAYGFAIGLDLDDTGSLNFGRIWIDYPSAISSGSGSIGIRTGTNTTKINIAVAMIWGVEYAVQHLASSSETLTFGYLGMHTVGTGLTVTGGDVVAPHVHITNTTSWAINVTSTASRVYARGIADSIGSAAYVAAPSGGTSEKLDIDLIVSDTSKALIGNAVLTLPVIASADPITIPTQGDTFLVSGTTNMGTVGGRWGGRKVTLIFQGVLTLFHGTGSQNVKLAGSTNLTTAAGTVLTIVHDGTSWQEVSRKTP